MLTAARSGEVREARWEEINMAANVWKVPAERMKTKRPHRVPLSTRALAILETALRAGTGDAANEHWPVARGVLCLSG